MIDLASIILNEIAFHSFCVYGMLAGVILITAVVAKKFVYQLGFFALFILLGKWTFRQPYFLLQDVTGTKIFEVGFYNWFIGVITGAVVATLLYRMVKSEHTSLKCLLGVMALAMPLTVLFVEELTIMRTLYP